MLIEPDIMHKIWNNLNTEITPLLCKNTLEWFQIYALRERIPFTSQLFPRGKLPLDLCDVFGNASLALYYDVVFSPEFQSEQYVCLDTLPFSSVPQTP
jgi:hypothetical protein